MTNFKTIKPMKQLTVQQRMQKEILKQVLHRVDDEKLISYITLHRKHFVFINLKHINKILNLESSRYAIIASKSTEEDNSPNSKTFDKVNKSKMLFRVNAEIDLFLSKYSIKKQNVLRHEDYRVA